VVVVTVLSAQRSRTLFATREWLFIGVSSQDAPC
jgi:hypothetical protein